MKHTGNQIEVRAAMMKKSFELHYNGGTILCALGGMALLMGIVAVFCKKEKLNKGLFYALSFIILAKTIVVEALRIAVYFGR